MKKVLHKAATRGSANHGWLKSYHTFSFANYQDSERMNFGMLRVLNDDIVQPKMGFGEHPHRNMEIISIPILGALSHKDSMGNKRSIEVGEVQVMSAGTGVTHSEFNDSTTDAVHFLQLWILTESENITPVYDQKFFDEAGRKNKFQTLVSPKSKKVEGSLTINQQGSLSMIDLDSDFEIDYQLKNGAYFFLIDGEVSIEEISLGKRDAVGISEVEKVSIKATKKSKLLIIDVPMS
ncbi:MULTISPECIES: pirin family protein [unclassified Polaribacter]|uniref:pirin family protein n=1 Tax=unclassified Polaribacter TaxID=196858 RepID=UPI0011BD8422|nr:MULTISPECIES: pirin family protein [unclassified Polaribacter]TXD51463.1 pirin family protein [Polaribacter sp. IC063]TXD61809.1 pirin family protein [Polaribacter sp. IC066]